MKPGCRMDSKVLQTKEDSNIKKKSCIKKMCFAVTTIVLVILLIGALVFIGLLKYHEQKRTREGTSVTFHTKNGELIIENVNVLNDEEVDITVPNDMRVAYDYKHGIIVYRFRDQQTGKEGACYATHMNRTETPGPEQFQELVKDNNVELTETSRSSPRQYVFTNRKLPSSMLSRNVLRMCERVDVNWMELSRNEGRTKRDAPCTEDYEVHRMCVTSRRLTSRRRLCHYFKVYKCPSGKRKVVFWFKTYRVKVNPLGVMLLGLLKNSTDT